MITASSPVTQINGAAVAPSQRCLIDAWTAEEKRQQQAARKRAALRIDLGAGDWQVAFETQDESEWRAYLRGLRAGPARADWAMTRVDILCGRLVQPTTYRLSVFVLDTACEQ